MPRVSLFAPSSTIQISLCELPTATPAEPQQLRTKHPFREKRAEQQETHHFKTREAITMAETEAAEAPQLVLTVEFT